MDHGQEREPAVGPDGRSLAFVSDRNGVSNIFLYDLDANDVYQLTDFYTGAQGITPLSPVLSWAREADRLAFVYFEASQYDVYSITNPRGAQAAAVPGAGAGQRRHPGPRGHAAARHHPLAAGEGGGAAAGRRGRLDLPDAVGLPLVQRGGPLGRHDPSGGSRSPSWRCSTRPTTACPTPASSPSRSTGPSSRPTTSPGPSIGYARDNFGRGFFGGSAISLSDILGNQQLIFAGYVNGRISEAQVLAAYANLSQPDQLGGGHLPGPVLLPGAERDRARATVRRRTSSSPTSAGWWCARRSASAYYPLSRFQRIEAGMRFANVDDAILKINEPYNPATGFATDDPFLETDNLPGVTYAQPSAALVFDNSLFGYVGPFYGRRYRLELAQTIGDWSFSQVTADYRRYDRIIGPDRLRHPAALLRPHRPRRARVPDLRRQHRPDPRQHLGLLPAERVPQRQRSGLRDRLLRARPPGRHPDRRRVGRAPVPDPEPVVRPAGGVPAARGRDLLRHRPGVGQRAAPSGGAARAGDDPVRVRTPLQTLGVSVRANLFGFAVARLDYSIPQERRAGQGPLDLQPRADVLGRTSSGPSIPA